MKEKRSLLKHEDHNPAQSNMVVGLFTECSAYFKYSTNMTFFPLPWPLQHYIFILC